MVVARRGGDGAARGERRGKPGAHLPTAEAGTPSRSAVDLLDVDESVIAPGDPARLTASGRARTRRGRRHRRRPNARDELWIPIVLVALVLLTIEGLVYERDTLARLRRAVAARLGRSRPSGRSA